MAEYIERESAMLLPELPKEYRNYQTDNLDDAYEQGWYDALCCLEHIPAANVAPVVHGKRLLADMSGAKAVSLHDIYRVIAGHSYYHGDRILAALTCIVEGKEVNPVRPADVAPVVHGRWINNEANGYKWAFVCSLCGYVDGHPFDNRHNFCPNCGAKMDEVSE